MTHRRSSPRTGFPFLDEPLERGAIVAFAHRGGLSPAPPPGDAGAGPRVACENTMKAFAHAVGLGYRYLETDVRATADGVLLAFHDPDLLRVTGRPGALAELTYAEVAGVLVGGLEPVPRMADLLEAFPQGRFNIDLKSPRAVEPLVDLVARTGAEERVCVGSFRGPVLREFRRRMRARSEVPVATSCGVATAAAMTLAPGRWAHRLPSLLRDTGRALQVPHHHRGIRVVDAAFVASAHAAGLHVHVWTVNDRAEIEELLDLGVDGIITDRVGVLRDVLVRRGQWQAAA